MIAVKPNNDAGRVLAALVDLGEATPRMVASRLWAFTEPTVAPPLHGPTYHTRFLDYARRRDERTARREAHTAACEAKAQALLQRLARQGLVAKRGPLVLTSYALNSRERNTAAAERVNAHPLRADVPADWVDVLVCRVLDVELTDYRSQAPRAMAALLRELLAGPVQVKRMRRAWRATLKRAIKLGLVQRPTERTPTLEAVALVTVWRQPVIDNEAVNAIILYAKSLKEVLRWRVYPAERPDDWQEIEADIPDDGRIIGLFANMGGHYEIHPAGGRSRVACLEGQSFHWRPVLPGPTQRSQS